MKKERIPEESETIAARRAARLHERLKKARSGLQIYRAWWSSGVIEALALMFLFALNFYLVYPFFGSTALDIPFSGPLIPLLAKTIEVFGPSLPFAFQILNIAFFLLFPLAFYFFIRRVSERKIIALLATLTVSLPFYPFAEIRVKAALLGGDGPHIASLTVIPIALFGVLSFVRRGGVKNFIVASVSSAIVALISPFGFLTYGFLSGITAFSEMLLGSARLKFFRLVTVFVVAAGLTSFWYNPVFFYWMITGPMGIGVRTMASKLIPVSFFVLPVLASFGYLLFDRKPNLQGVFLASFYTITFAIISLAGGGFFPSHPSRYVSEFGVSLAFLLSIAVIKFLDYLKVVRVPKKARFKWLTTSNMQKLANSLTVFLFLVPIFGVIFGKAGLSSANEKVLGLWTGVARGEIWLAREQVSAISSYSGYAISLTTVLLLILLEAKAKVGRKEIQTR